MLELIGSWIGVGCLIYILVGLVIARMLERSLNQNDHVLAHVIFSIIWVPALLIRLFTGR